MRTSPTRQRSAHRLLWSSGRGYGEASRGRPRAPLGPRSRTAAQSAGQHNRRAGPGREPRGCGARARTPHLHSTRRKRTRAASELRLTRSDTCPTSPASPRRCAATTATRSTVRAGAAARADQGEHRPPRRSARCKRLAQRVDELDGELEEVGGPTYAGSAPAREPPSTRRGAVHPGYPQADIDQNGFAPPPRPRWTVSASRRGAGRAAARRRPAAVRGALAPRGRGGPACRPGGGARREDHAGRHPRGGRDPRAVATEAAELRGTAKREAAAVRAAAEREAAELRVVASARPRRRRRTRSASRARPSSVARSWIASSPRPARTPRPRSRGSGPRCSSRSSAPRRPRQQGGARPGGRRPGGRDDAPAAARAKLRAR